MLHKQDGNRCLRGWATALCLAVAVSHTAAADGKVHQSERHAFRLVEVADDLENPWGMAFLPDGGILITERPGRLRLVRDGQLQPEPIEGLPEIEESGQGGLLDVALHPDFASNSLIYFTFSGEGSGGVGTELARARFDGRRLTSLERLLAVEPKSRGGRHFGSRIVFGTDGDLFITSGDRGSPDRAQDQADLAGTVIRLMPDGRVPADNPFTGRSGVRPEIYSYGHRNPQGLARDPKTGTIWAVEHGPRGGDELNLIRAGKNYGWPVITYGKSYAGFAIGEGSAKTGMEQPAKYWVPSISPSGLTFYSGAAFPKWQGNIFVGALSARRLVRLEVEGESVVSEERLLGDLDERIRDVRQGPDGLIYILTDSGNGKLLRLEPAD